MGVLTVLQVTVVFLVALAYLPGLPPYDAEFTAFTVTPPRPVALNHRLDKTERLLEGKVKGPETFASFNGRLFTTLAGGDVIEIIDDNHFVPIARLGNQCDNTWDDELCGRPLGLRFDKKGMLYVADAYYGLFKIDIKTGAVTRLVSMSVPIDGRRPSAPNSLAIASDGTVFWSDSSLNFKLEDGIYSFLADPSGRLLRYNPTSNTSTVLVEHLHFGNGVALSRDEEFVIVSDLHKSRILRYYLKGPKKGTQDVFLDGIPGMPDNLASTGDGGFYVALAAISGDHLVLSQVIGPYPTLRKMLARLLALIELPFKQIEALVPNHYTKAILHWVGNLETVELLASDLGGFLILDSQGNIKDTLFCQDGSIKSISEIHEFKGFYYLGSYTNNYIGRIPIQRTKQ